jgi:methyl-accepting chemotaxis protein
MNIQSMKLSSKMGLGFAVPLTIMALLVAIVFAHLTSMEKNSVVIKDRSVESAAFMGIARQMKLDTVQIQQWLTDISATRGLDGLNDGFDEAQKSYDSFVTGLAQFKRMYEKKDSADGIKQVEEIEKALVSYYEAGKKMAQAYVDGGPEMGNKFMASFDEAAENMTENLTPFVEAQESELAESLSAIVQSAGKTQNFILIAGLLTLLAGAAIAFFTTRSITGPIQKVIDFVDKVAKGDFTSCLNIDQQDEIGKMSTALCTTISELGSMIKEIISGVTTLSSSSTDLATISTQLTSTSATASERARNVASTSEEMSVNMSSVSAAMEQSASNVTMVATAAEEMSATVNEIAQNTSKAKSISEKAVIQSQESAKKVTELGTAASKIGKVTEVITEISEQTNLLALNATIEAARAGEAGKGFAVVANEIKELARQTASATVDIRVQIEGMQGTTNSTIADIKIISEVINEINDVITSIASAVEQQSAATSDISENIAQAAGGIGEVNENVAQSSIAIQDVTRDITEISNASTEINSSSQNVNESANELSTLAEKLNSLVRRFKVA